MTAAFMTHFIQASTVSSRDCSVRANGDPNTAPNLFIPGFQAVGQVCAVGTKVDPLKIRLGDRVAALLPNGGGNAKYVSIPVSWAIILPEGANHDDIICLVANYMTAYQCLKLAKKDGAPLTSANVLITGGSGPVGQALIELALQEGANVYSTAHKMHEEHLTK
jgi:NADPH2:quinone reductase